MFLRPLSGWIDGEDPMALFPISTIGLMACDLYLKQLKHLVVMCTLSVKYAYLVKAATLMNALDHYYFKRWILANHMFLLDSDVAFIIFPS